MQKMFPLKSPLRILCLYREIAFEESKGIHRIARIVSHCLLHFPCCLHLSSPSSLVWRKACSAPWKLPGRWQFRPRLSTVSPCCSAARSATTRAASCRGGVSLYSTVRPELSPHLDVALLQLLQLQAAAHQHLPEHLAQRPGQLRPPRQQRRDLNIIY